jgi:CheY-like chemotaxis protein
METAMTNLDPQARSSGGSMAARVLVVDDDPAMRAMVERVLRPAGYAVLAAANGEEALRVLEHGGVDVVLTDLLMPDMDGIELIRTLAARAPDLPVVTLSGADASGPGNLLRAAQMLGAVATLAKPVAPAELRDAVDHLLAPRAARAVALTAA